MTSSLNPKSTSFSSTIKQNIIPFVKPDYEGQAITKKIQSLGVDPGFISSEVLLQLQDSLPIESVKSEINKNDQKNQTNQTITTPTLLSKIIQIPDNCEKKNWLSYPKYEIEANLQNQKFDEFFELDDQGKINFIKPIQEKQSDINSGNFESIPIQKQLKTGIVHLPISPQPGEIGNSYIVGHTSNFASVKSDYNTIFKPFESKSELGDEFYIWDHKCRKLKFKVFEVKSIRSEDVQEAYKNFDQKRVVTLQGSILEYVNGYLEPTRRWITRGELVLDLKSVEIKN